ncbi:MAG: 2-polyprenyl-3-methyl-5-hydroxy-6-metoxy-1,4-benzoquinol methylase [Bacteriovoracaceae bacterium]|jgi:2-polyprenyl-3-methyl-5-hydroxy-6-metoxy-1,4-benzoquinol methylase
MSQEIFDSYVENAFNGESGQALFKIEEFRTNYFKFFPEDKNSRILDIGVGRGEMLKCLSDKGYVNYLGVDISPSTIEHCKNLNLNCLLVEDTVKFLDDNKESYNLITLLDVLEHFDLEFALVFLKALFNSLNSGGRIIIQVPNMQAPDGHLHFFNDVTHKLGFVEHSLKQILVTAGIKDFKIYPYETITNSSIKSKVKFFLRGLFRKYVKFTRVLTGNLNPEILTPVFYAVVEKK